MNDTNNCKNVADIEKYLRKIDYIIRIKGREILNDFSITSPQFTALQILINNGDMTIGELSQKMSLACSTITDLIGRMEKTELVKRKKDDKDKRVVRIEVLPKGFDILEKVLEKRRKFLANKLEKIDDKQKEILNKGLNELYIAMNE